MYTCKLLGMGVSWEAIDRFFADDHKFLAKFNETWEWTVKFRGLWKDEK